MARRARKRLSKTQKEKLKQASKWLGLGLLSYEGFVLFVRQRQRKRDVFNLALQKQAFNKKPLLVIGNPGGDLISRVMGNDFDCADLCIDPKGCASCTNVIAKPVDEALASLGDSSYNVFVAPGTLERVPDMNATLTALQRVSGGNLFIAHTNPWTVTSLFAKRRIKSAPPTGNFTEWRDLPWMPGPSKLERRELAGLKGLDTQSVWPWTLGMGAFGAFVAFKLNDDKGGMPAAIGAAAGAALGTGIWQSKRAVGA